MNKRQRILDLEAKLQKAEKDFQAKATELESLKNNLDSATKQVNELESLNVGASRKVDYLDKVPTPVMAIDKEYNVIYMNIAGAEAVGRMQDDCIGKKCFNLFNTDHCNTSECRCHQAMQKDDVVDGETIAKLPGGAMPIA
ncbi:MAG: hypothetical protein C0594_03650, partial [Marinilabiliales bacterium]